jgi:molybdenum cofactor synthesis domain-containing protein
VDAVPLRALAITVSTRAASGVYDDRSGPLLVSLLVDAGCEVDGPVVIPDGDPVEAELRSAVAGHYDVVVTTGGTGISPTDRTPEMTARVIEREVAGIAEAIRAAGRAATPTAVLSRGLAGVCGRTLIVNLPGSTGGVRDGMGVVGPLIAHVASQLAGADHPTRLGDARVTSRAAEARRDVWVAGDAVARPDHVAAVAAARRP